MNKRKKSITILIADDNSNDRALVQKALEKNRLASNLYCVQDGEELMDYLTHRGKYSTLNSSPRPDIILLDLNMPGKDGREAIKEIKSDPNLRQIPIVVLTDSRMEGDIYHTYDEGGNSYIAKPLKFEALVEMMESFGKYWAEVVRLPPKSR